MAWCWIRRKANELVVEMANIVGKLQEEYYHGGQMHLNINELNNKNARDCWLSLLSLLYEKCEGLAGRKTRDISKNEG